jgi:hypothetical protein
VNDAVSMYYTGLAAAHPHLAGGTDHPAEAVPADGAADFPATQHRQRPVASRVEVVHGHGYLPFERAGGCCTAVTGRRCTAGRHAPSSPADRGRERSSPPDGAAPDVSSPSGAAP